MHQHRQIHVWITESDYLLLREQAVVTRESVSGLIRRFIKNERQRLRMAGSGDAIDTAVPENAARSAVHEPYEEGCRGQVAGDRWA